MADHKRANIETYLKLEIARRTGIFAGVRFLFLERFLSDLVSPRGSRRLALGRRTLQNLLINLFLDDAARGALPRAVLEYLGPAGQPGEDRSLRAFQLADHLSRLFEEYALSRPEMLEE